MFSRVDYESSIGENPTRKPIDHDFFRKHIAGGSNPIIFNNLYPDLSEEERERMWTEKEKNTEDERLHLYGD